MAERFGDQVWDLVFGQLRQMSESSDSGGSGKPGWMYNPDEEELDTVHEEERTWRDPSAHKLRSQIALWLRGDAAIRSVIKVGFVFSLSFSISLKGKQLRLR